MGEGGAEEVSTVPAQYRFSPPLSRPPSPADTYIVEINSDLRDT